MKEELFKKLELSFAGVGLTVLQLGEGLTRLNKSIGFSIDFVRNVTHRKRCVLIALALSKASNHEVKGILWNLFLNT